jgi:thioesterase domain-containing protein/acyl carrier protein
LDRKGLPMPGAAAYGTRGYQAPEGITELGTDLTNRTSASPRDTVELELARIWEEVLAISPVKIDQNFFDLGGHSLRAIRLIWAIERRMRTKLPVAAVLQHPTIQSLAVVLRNMEPQVPRGPLVEIQRGGSKRPMFFVHGAGGSAFVFMALARRLGPDRPFFAFQHAGLECETWKEMSLELQAQRYIEALRAVQPTGPYILGGWSTGGLVAFEMARQLRDLGEELAFLAILDCQAFCQEEEKLVSEEKFFRQFLFTLGLPAEKFARTSLPDDSLEARLGMVQRLMIDAQLLPWDIDPSFVCRLYEVFTENMKARALYRPPVTNLALHIWYACENITANDYMESKSQFGIGPAHLRNFDPSLGWARVAGKVKVGYAPGNHTTMLNEPHVAHLARELASCLQDNDGGDGG